MLRRVKIGPRLAIGFAIVLLFMVAGIGVGVRRLAVAERLTETLAAREFQKTVLANQVGNIANDNCRATMELFLLVDKRQAKPILTRIKHNKSAITDRLVALDRMVSRPEGKALLRDIVATRKPYVSSFTRAARELLEQGDRPAATHIVTAETLPAIRVYLASISALIDFQGQVMAEAAAKAKQDSRSGRQHMLLLGIAALVVGAAFAVSITRSITRPLHLALGVSHKVALGDLSASVTESARDETGQLLQALRSVVESLGEMSTAAERVAGGDLTATVQPRSEQDRLGQAFQQLLQTTRELVAETDQLVRAAQDGKLDQRGTPEQFQGAFRDLVQGMNATLDAFVAPVNEAAAVLGRVAERDLTARMQGAYQGEFATVKTALNTAVQNLEDALFQVTVSAEQIMVASSEIGNGSHSLAQSASEQSSALEEVAGSLQEMASMTRQNAANSQEARSLIDATRSTTQKGTDSMGRLSSAIDQIQSSASATARIVKTIDEIAFQTNLLALNAAVEAARAGDAGKGFAVVAEEVRNLAMRSAEAAKNTAQLIEESVRNAESGVTINGEVLRNLSEIHEQVNKVGEVMGEVAAASGQQSQGVEQITSAVGQMNQVTRLTAASAEESASASEELTAQSEEMKSMVATFRLSTACSGLQAWDGAVRCAPASLFEGEPAAAKPPTPAAEGPLPLAGAPRHNGRANGKGAGHGLAMDSRSVIPFDEDDRDILKEF